MKTFNCIFAAALVALAAGCVPERVVWSPDGSRAIVLGDDALHLCDVNGKLSGSTAPQSSAAWMPDGKRFVAAIEITLKTWDEVSKAFPREAADAAKNADAVQAQLLTEQQGWGPFLSDTPAKLNLSQQQIELAVMELRDKDSQGMMGKLNDLMRKSVLEQTLVEETMQIFTAGDERVTPGPVLLRRTREQNGQAHAVRVSPSGELVAVTVDQSGNNPTNQGKPDELLVVPTDGSGKTCDLGLAAAYPDWSVDGKYVVYIRPASWHSDDKDLLPGVLTRQQVLDDKGALFDPAALPAAEDLAGLAFDSWARVRVARDGRIFFSATELTLPVAAADVPTQGTIFYYDPGHSATLTRAVPRGAADTIGNSPNYFELSPDARFVSIPFGDGRVSVLDIAKGTAEVVQPIAEGNGKDLKLQTVPEWRTATELTFIRPTADLQRHEIVRYSVTDKSATPISGGWPEGTFDILTKPREPATQPSSGAK